MPSYRNTLPRSPYCSPSHRLRWPVALGFAALLTLGVLWLLVAVPQPMPHARTLRAVLPPAQPSPVATPATPVSPPAVPHTAAMPATQDTPPSTAPAPMLTQETDQASPLDSPSQNIAGDARGGNGIVLSLPLGMAAGESMPPADETPDIACPQQTKPRFPAKALSDGIQGGEVLARFHLAADGSVAQVDILQETPAGYFAAAVRAAARGWRCQGGSGDSVKVRFPFVTQDR